MNFNKSYLLSGIDIPIAENISIHQPTFQEIALIGEEFFWSSANIFGIEEDDLRQRVIDLIEDDAEKCFCENCNYYQLFLYYLSIDPFAKIAFLTICTLLFPSNNVELVVDPDNFISFGQKRLNRIKEISIYVTEEEKFKIKNKLFVTIIDIIREIFMITTKAKKESEFKPVNERAEEIAKKILQGRERIGKKNEGKTTPYILSHYITILSIGVKIDLITLNKYTIPQIMYTYKRFQLNEVFEMQKSALGLGTTSIEFKDWEEKFF